MSTAAPLNRIVVPIDGSEASQAALVYAANIPCRELVLVHVAVDREVIVPDWVLHQDSAEHTASFREALEARAEEYRTDSRTVTVDMRIGDVAEEIMAAGDDADLIVMMTHGRGAAGRMIFGSMADRVVRHSATPVLLVRVGEMTRHPRLPKRIVIALDGSALSEKAIPVAGHVATITGLPITLVRSVGLHDVKTRLHDSQATVARNAADLSPSLYDDTLTSIREEATAYLAERAAQFNGINVDTQVLEGSVPFTIMWAVNPDDLLVLTSRGQSGYKRWALGSTAEKLIREAPCPVLICRGPEDVPQVRYEQ